MARCIIFMPFGGDRAVVAYPGGPVMKTVSIIIALDYSGTLSAGAVAFGRAERLLSALSHSGLADFGIDTPERYWQGVVVPSWLTASVTRYPFARTIVDQVAALAPATAKPPADALNAAADRFVAAYLSASGISPPWQPVLRRLCRLNNARVVVATDHYCDATGAIIDHLAAMGLSAAAIEDSANRQCDVCVANSADLGCHKITPEYWQRVSSLSAPEAETVVLVDDFGGAESDVAGYAAASAVSHRRRRTREALGTVKDWAVHSYHFTPTGTAASLPGAVKDAEAYIRKVIHDV